MPVARPVLVHLDTAAFIGLAQRGPINTPVPVISLPEFHTVFGDALDGLLLPQAVGAFFANGGRRCVVVRCMHMAQARAAQMTLPGLAPDAVVVARNPGAWGNQLRLVTRLIRRTLPLRLSTAADKAWPQNTLLAPAHRAQLGTTLLLAGIGPLGSLTFHISEVSAPIGGVAAVTLDNFLPVGFFHPDNGPQLLSGTVELLVRLDILLGDVPVETWDAAALHPDHPDYVARLIGRRAISEALLAPRMSGGDEPDLAWGTEDDAPGSEFLRPSLLLQNVVLLPTSDLIAAPDGVLFDAMTLVDPASGNDATFTTQRTDFFEPTPAAPGDTLTGLMPFADRPGAIDALAAWDDQHPADPIAMLAMPDLLHPDAPAAVTDTNVLDATLCFGVCAQSVSQSTRSALPYPDLGGDDYNDLQAAQAKLVAACDSTGGRVALLDLPPGLAAGDIVRWRRRWRRTEQRVRALAARGPGRRSAGQCADLATIRRRRRPHSPRRTTDRRVRLARRADHQRRVCARAGRRLAGARLPAPGTHRCHPADRKRHPVDGLTQHLARSRLDAHQRATDHGLADGAIAARPRLDDVRAEQPDTVARDDASGDAAAGHTVQCRRIGRRHRRAIVFRPLRQYHDDTERSRHRPGDHAGRRGTCGARRVPGVQPDP